MKHALPILGFLVLLCSGRPALTAGESPPIKTAGDFEVETVKNIAYYDGKDADQKKHKLDLYLPKGQKNFPVLFFVHGGAWKMGDRSQYARLGSQFARQGVGVVAISYRLSPDVKHPAHIEDVARAFAWTVANIGKHGGNPKEIFLSGHSAGGHLVALLAADESYLKAHQLSAADIRGVMPISGVYTIAGMRDVFGDDRETVRNASPLNHVRKGLPPMLILYAEKDLGGLSRMAERFHEELQKAHCDSQCQQIADRDHASIIIGLTRLNDPATQLMLEFMARHGSLKLTEKK